MGGLRPAAFVSILRMRDALLFRAGESLASASARGNLVMAAAAVQTRRLFGLMGNAFRPATKWRTNKKGMARGATSDDDFEETSGKYGRI